MIKRFFLNILGNGGGSKDLKKFKFSLNKQLMWLVSIIVIFLPFFFTWLIWGDLDPAQKLTLLSYIFIYYPSISATLIGAYTWKRIKENGNYNEIEDLE